MKIYIFSMICLLTLTVSCQEKSNILRKEKTTIYSVQGDATSYQKDTIRFIEEEIYDNEGALLKRVFYHPDGSLKATENFLNKKGEQGSDYLDIKEMFELAKKRLKDILALDVESIKKIIKNT